MTRLLQLVFAALLFVPFLTFGSGQIVVQPGQTVEVEAETIMSSPEFSWTIMKGDTVLDTLKQQKLAYVFSQPGNYVANLTISNSTGAEELSSVDILVGKGPNELLPLGAVFRSLPPTNDNNVAYINPQKPQAILYAGESKGKIAEYRIDRNIAVDSNGDGDPANDVDNRSDASFQSGAPWGIVFSKSGTSTTRLTVVDREGNSDSKDIVFQPDDRMLQNEKLTAIISSVPSFNDAGELRLTGDTAEAVFYFGESRGNIIQYRFDRDIALDADGNGDPADDIDNKQHSSFLSGEPLQVTLNKPASYDQIVQLIVVSADGKGSRIRKKIVFEGPQANLIPSVVPTLKPKLFLDFSRAVTGTPIHFYVLGAPQGSRYSWDFDSDGQMDGSGSSADAEFVYTTPGEYSPNVTVVFNEDTVTISDAITIIDPSSVTAPPMEEFSAPTADFTSTVEQGVVKLSNASSADPRLSNNTLQYEWDFGDGSELSTDQNPEHTYATAGAFPIILRVTDINGKTSTKSVEIVIAAVGEVSQSAEPSTSAEASAQPTVSGDGFPGQSEATPDVSELPGSKKPGGVIGTIGKLLMFLLLPIFLLIVGYLVFRKIQNPDMQLKEILDDELSKLTRAKKPPASDQSNITIAPIVGSTALSQQPLPSENRQDKVLIKDATIVTDAKQAPIAQGAVSQENTDLGISNSPVPEWLRLAATEEKPSVFAETQQSKAVDLPPPDQVEPKRAEIVQAQPTPDEAARVETPKSAEKPAQQEGAPTFEVKNTLPDWLRGDEKTVPSAGTTSAAPAVKIVLDTTVPSVPQVAPPANAPTASASTLAAPQQVHPTQAPVVHAPVQQPQSVQIAQPKPAVPAAPPPAVHPKAPTVLPQSTPPAGSVQGQAAVQPVTSPSHPAASSGNQASASPFPHFEGTLFENNQKSGTTGQQIFPKPDEGKKPL